MAAQVFQQMLAVLFLSVPVCHVFHTRCHSARPCVRRVRAANHADEVGSKNDVVAAQLKCFEHWQRTASMSRAIISSNLR